MILRKCKILTALLLTFILAMAPMSLFASVWDKEQGQAFKARLEELVGGMHAGWVIEDMELLRSHDILSNEDIYALIAMGVDAALEYYLTPEQLEEFWSLQNVSSRFWLLFDYLLDPGIWIDWGDWGWYDDWDWTPGFSGIWFDVGQALRVQLTDILGERYAIWIAEDLDWNRASLGDAVFFEILALDLAEFLAEHMTDEEIEAWQGQEDEWDIYWDFWNLLRKVYFPGWEDRDDWDDWYGGWQPVLSPIWQEEGLALKTQLIDILGENSAIWIAEELDWYYEIGSIKNDTWTEILNMDVMAALEEHFTTEELADFLEYDSFWIHWILWDYILEPMIWAGWGDFDEVTREDIIAALEIVTAAHIARYGFDIAYLLDAADIEIDVIIDMAHFFITIDGFGTIMWQMWQWGEDWLIHYIDDMLWSFHLMDEADILFLQLFPNIALMYELLGDDAEAFFELRIFDDISLVLGDETLAEALFANPDMEDILHTYGPELLNILDFRLYDALSELFAAEGNEWPEGLAVMDALLSGFLSDNIDALYEFYTTGSPVSVTLAQPIPFWNHLVNWEYVILDEESLEERIAFDIAESTEITIDLIHVMGEGTHLNLFYANHADYYAHFVIEFPGGGGLREHIFEVAPGTSATTQLTANELADVNMVWVMIVNIDSDEVSGEFALRKTRQLLQ